MAVNVELPAFNREPGIGLSDHVSGDEPLFGSDVTRVDLNDDRFVIIGIERNVKTAIAIMEDDFFSRLRIERLEKNDMVLF